MNLVEGYLRELDLVAPNVVVNLVLCYWPGNYCVTVGLNLKLKDVADISTNIANELLIKNVYNEILLNGKKVTVGENNYGNKIISRGICGGAHSVVISSNSYYNNNLNQQMYMVAGMGDGFLVVPQKFLISLLPRLIQVEVGDRHTLFLDENGTVYGKGDNSYNQCGLENSSESLSKPTIIFDGVKSIRCGEYHSLCLTRNQKLYTFGLNTYGQLFSSKSIRRVKVPTLNDYFKTTDTNIIACGKRHSCIITRNNECFLAGCNLDDQIGCNAARFAAFVPAKFEVEKRIILIEKCSLGANHTLLLTKNNQIFSFGGNEKNQCSRRISKSQIRTPHLITEKELDSNNLILDVVAGNEFSVFILHDFLIPPRDTLKKQMKFNNYQVPSLKKYKRNFLSII